jgi:hypothetical protein
MVSFDAFWKDLLYHLAYPIIFTILSLPFAYAAAALRYGAAGDFLRLNHFANRRGLVVAASLFFLLAGFLSTRDVYDATWQPTVRVQQTVWMGTDTASVEISSGEYLSGLRLTYDGKDTLLDGRFNSFRFRPVLGSEDVWPAVDEAVLETPVADSLRLVRRRLEINSSVRPYTVAVTYRSGGPFEAASEWAHGGNRRSAKESDRLKSYYWYSFPEMPLVIPIDFTLKTGQVVTERVEITYDSLSSSLELQRPLTVVTRRMVVSREDEF